MKVLLSGYQGLGNLGDEAIARAMIDALMARGHAPSLLSGAPSVTREAWGVPAFHRLRSLVPAVMASDVVVSGGGGLLQDVTSARSLRYYLGVMRLAKLLGKATIVFAQSVGPLSPTGLRAVARTLPGVPCFVRDEPSRDLLVSLGVDADVVPDAALALEPATRGHGEGVGDRGGVVLVPRSDVPGASAALDRLAQRLVARGVRVSVLPFDLPSDEVEADALAGRAGVMRLTTEDPRVASSWLAGADLVVSVRLHGLILAARAGVAHVGVAYDPKVSGFAATSGAPLLAVPVDASQLAEVVDRALETECALRMDRKARAARFARDVEVGFDALDAAIRERVAG